MIYKAEFSRVHKSLINARSVVQSLSLMDTGVLAGPHVLLRKYIPTRLNKLKMFVLIYFFILVVCINDYVGSSRILVDTTITKSGILIIYM